METTAVGKITKEVSDISQGQKTLMKLELNSNNMESESITPEFIMEPLTKFINDKPIMWILQFPQQSTKLDACHGPSERVLGRQESNKAEQNELKCAIPSFENVQRMTAEEFKAFSQNLAESINSPEDDRRKGTQAGLCQIIRKEASHSPEPFIPDDINLLSVHAGGGSTANPPRTCDLRLQEHMWDLRMVSELRTSVDFEEESDDDDTEALLAEPEEQARKEQEQKVHEERIPMENILSGNLLNLTGPSQLQANFKVKIRWDEDVVFKNCVKGVDNQKKDKRFKSYQEFTKSTLALRAYLYRLLSVNMLQFLIWGLLYRRDSLNTGYKNDSKSTFTEVPYSSLSVHLSKTSFYTSTIY
eukprot:bmy_18730T0